MSDTKTKRFKIVAAPIGPGGNYRAWPKKTTYIRRFASAAKRQDYWKRFVMPKSNDIRGLEFQISMIDEWHDGWEFVSQPRYAKLPVIGEINSDPSLHIVECGRAGKLPGK